jgi:hypothetical protein
MPGHNHFSDCTCGWCFKTGYGSYEAISVNNSQWRANDQLRDLGISRVNKASCFVNPNANCPVCGAWVYCYENEFGSKVYFDDLGGNWPKHPCTDRKTTTNSQAKAKPRNFRSFEEVARITRLVRAADIDFDGNFRRDYRQEPWTLFRVLRTMQLAEEIVAFGVVLDLRNPQNLYIVTSSKEVSLKEDDVIGLRGDRASLPHPISLEPVVVRVRTFGTDQAILDYFDAAVFDASASASSGS